MNPPNLQDARTCTNCAECGYLIMNDMIYCKAFDTNIPKGKVCSQWEEEE